MICHPNGNCSSEHSGATTVAPLVGRRCWTKNRSPRAFTHVPDVFMCGGSTTFLNTQVPYLIWDIAPSVEQTGYEGTY